MDTTRRAVIGIIVLGVSVTVASAIDHHCTVYEIKWRHSHTHCGLFGWGRCGVWRYYVGSRKVCCPGYTGWNCNTPICNPGCWNGGTCYAPNKCRCTAGHTGATCGRVTCSHLKPCFPGTCSFPDTCACFSGFTGTGCRNFDGNNNRPVINVCSLTLKHIRRLDQREKFYQNLPCSNSSTSDVVWSNQEKFNFAEFSLEGYYPPKYEYYPQLNYIRDFGFGIVYGDMHVRHTKIDRNGYCVAPQCNAYWNAEIIDHWGDIHE